MLFFPALCLGTPTCILIEKENLDPDKTNNSDYRYRTKEIYAILLGSRRNVSELLRVVLDKDHPDPDNRTFLITATGTKLKKLCYSSWLVTLCVRTPP
jgi:hypothetical protein